MTPEQSQILIVDDDDYVRDMLVARLQFRGYQVAYAKNGREALDLCRQHDYDLILLDIMMPEMNGFQVLQQLQAKNDATPVVVMSALDNMENVVRCIELGAEDYLYKPIQSSLLWARLKASLEKKYYRDREQMRISELKLLQQIDQELNTTLDQEEVSRLTLHWAMERAGAVAGIMGNITEGRLERWAAVGFAEGTEEALSSIILDVETQEWRLVQEAITPASAVHPDATHRIILPIHRDHVVSALVLLEVAEPCTLTTLDFLRRLGLHAAIALHNAKLYADVQAANLAKSNFVAMVSHELKNPLMAILSYVDLIRRGAGGLVSEKQESFLQIIRSSATRIHNLSLELDDITRVETGQFDLSMTAVSFMDVLDEVVHLLAQQIAAKEQKLRLDIPPDLPLLHADGQRLNQILMNLISNASKYTPAAGQIIIRVHPVSDTAVPMLQITVQDTGIGIAKADQAQIFSQFFRAEDAQVRAERGTGLGLNITKKLVELQGGQINFTSEYGEGTTFSFTIPIAEETAVSTPA